MADPITDNVFCLSPMGNNTVEALADGHATDIDTTPRGVPCYYDSITGQWIAEISKEDQENREISLEVARKTMDDQAFLTTAGFINS
jgi:hypothetical protein